MAEKRIHGAIRAAGGSVNGDGSISFPSEAEFRAAIGAINKALAGGGPRDAVASMIKGYANLPGNITPLTEQIRYVVREELARVRAEGLQRDGLG